ncbi:hypothetical protein [Picosynechococcus sp. PCC 7003]
MTCVILKSLLYFVLAGLFEIGGGYLVWLPGKRKVEPSPFWAGCCY